MADTTKSLEEWKSEFSNLETNLLNKKDEISRLEDDLNHLKKTKRENLKSAIADKRHLEQTLGTEVFDFMNTLKDMLERATNWVDGKIEFKLPQEIFGYID